MRPGVHATFRGQIAVTSMNGNSFSLGGDSGSILWNESFEAAALLFAGTSQGGFDGSGVTYANPISEVLAGLDIDSIT